MDLKTDSIELAIKDIFFQVLSHQSDINSNDGNKDAEVFLELFKKSNMQFKLQKVKPKSAVGHEKTKCTRIIKTKAGVEKYCGLNVKDNTYTNFCTKHTNAINKLPPNAFFKLKTDDLFDKQNITNAVSNLNINRYMSSKAISHEIHVINCRSDVVAIVYSYMDKGDAWIHRTIGIVQNIDNNVYVDIGLSDSVKEISKVIYVESVDRDVLDTHLINMEKISTLFQIKDNKIVF